MNVILILFIALSSNHALAQLSPGSGGAGNGGDVIVCVETTNPRSNEYTYPSGLYSLDYLLTHPTGHQKSNTMDSKLTSNHNKQNKDHDLANWDQSHKHIESVLARIFPEWLTKFQTFVAHIFNTDETKPHVWQKQILPLTDIKDEALMNELPDNCRELKQAIIQLPHPHHPDMREFLYDPNIIQQLAATGLQYSYLMVHEFLWTVGLKSAHDIRMINSLLHSKKSATMTRAEFITILFRRDAIEKNSRDQLMQLMHEAYLKSMASYIEGKISLAQLEKFIKDSGIDPLSHSRFPIITHSLLPIDGDAIDLAAFHGDIELLKMLQRFGDININRPIEIKDFTLSPLHFALIKGQKHMVQHLVDLGADTSIESTGLWKRILTLIIIENNIEAMIMLFSGEYIKTDCDVVSLERHLAQAIRLSRNQIAEALLLKGADPTRFIENRQSALFYDNESQYLAFRGKNETQYIKNYDALLAAAWNGNLDIFRKMLGHPGVKNILNQKRYLVTHVYSSWGSDVLRNDYKTLRATIEEIIDRRRFPLSENRAMARQAALDTLKSETNAESDVIRGNEVPVKNAADSYPRH